MSSLLKVSHLSGDIYECRPLFILNKINSMMEMNVIYATGSMINIASLNTGCTLYIFEGHSAVVTSIHVFNADSSNINKHDFNDSIEIISTSLDGTICVWNMVTCYFESIYDITQCIHVLYCEWWSLCFHHAYLPTSYWALMITRCSVYGGCIRSSKK